MSARQEIPEDTKSRQRLASDPRGSAWVSANAGSGKTFVLTQRVVRLLLGGVPPGRILCLTFTKAAAANMSIRVFEILGRWVTMPDAELAAAIVETGAPSPTAVDLAAARRLFARTVETPGGLKIQTIHAFCEKLLHAFPFEANVAARFTVIEDVRQAELLSRAQEAALARGVAEPASAFGQALQRLGATLSATAFEGLIRNVSGHYEGLRERLRVAGGFEALHRALAEALGTGGLDVASIENAMLQDGLAPSEWESIGRHLVSLGGNATGERLIVAATAPAGEKLDAYVDVYLTRALAPRADSYLAKKLRGLEPALCGRMDQERERLVGMIGRRRAAEALERTMALLHVAGAILDTYETLKRRQGLLDFADLIERTRRLLARSDAAWVLYKLDSGIDHILVDEAQDTSPGQWEILQALSRDFFSGDSARAAHRTFFAVGDEKQSIYSFQGARPAMFDATRRDYQQRALDVKARFSPVSLLLSFRSVATVLDVVDRIFQHGGNAKGLQAEAGPPMPHQALKAKVPGLVELWRPIVPTLVPDPDSWRLPVDVPDATEPPVILARRVADTIARMTASGSGETVASAAGRRPVRAGDILILVRSRNAFFDAVIRALKERHVAVAGADRLNLTEHIAVMDLIAAGRAALLPDDDLTLASLLKSPLLGLDDDDLLRLAPGRTGTLAAALDASDLPRDRDAARALAIWRDRAATLTPFGFYMRLLGQDGGRRAMLGRLGPEAGDVLDEFMALTLAHERDGAPSLLTFLARLEETSLSIKRDMEQAGDAVRVMTVHAAKGLEAKIVFLPDTCGAPSGRHDPALFDIAPVGAPSLPIWSGKADADPPAVAPVRAAGRDAALDEHRRLLYVALTRAEERLYIAGFHGVQGQQAGSWYEMIEAADLGLTEVPAPWDASETIQRRADPVEAMVESHHAIAVPAMTDLPPWITRPAPREAPVAPPIRPSNALGAADQIDREDDQERRGATRNRDRAVLGRLMHLLLQHLPDVPLARRRDAALRFLAAKGKAFEPAVRETLAENALKVLSDPALAPLYGPNSRAEVAIAARLPRQGREDLEVTGQIDRICVTPEAIWIADYKSGGPRALDHTAPSYLAQLALYRAAMQPLYPDRAVRAFLVWTTEPGVTELPAETLDRIMVELLAR